MTAPIALLNSSITSLPLLARGKVRDNYAVGHDRILMVASDRLSAFDVVMGEPIPGKGELLTRMALFWFARLGHVVPNHLTGEDPLSVVQAHARQASGSDARGETRRLLLSGLTHRERQTITCAMSGKTIKETALELGVSPTTVITYRTRAFTRLGIRSQRELMALVGQP